MLHLFIFHEIDLELWGNRILSLQNCLPRFCFLQSSDRTYTHCISSFLLLDSSKFTAFLLDSEKHIEEYFLSKVDRDEESRFTPFFIFLSSPLWEIVGMPGVPFSPLGFGNLPFALEGAPPPAGGGLKCHIIMNSRRPGWRRCALHGSGRLHTTQR